VRVIIGKHGSMKSGGCEDMERQRYHFFHVFRSSSLTTASLSQLGCDVESQVFPRKHLLRG